VDARTDTNFGLKVSNLAASNYYYKSMKNNLQSKIYFTLEG